MAAEIAPSLRRRWFAEAARDVQLTRFMLLRGLGFIYLHIYLREVVLRQEILQLAASFVRSYAGNKGRLKPQLLQVVGYIHGSATRLCPGRQHIPQDFTETDRFVLGVHMLVFKLEPGGF